MQRVLSTMFNILTPVWFKLSFSVNFHFLTIWQHCFLIYLGRRPGQQKSELICIYAFFMLVSILLTLVTTFNLSHWTMLRKIFWSLVMWVLRVNLSLLQRDCKNAKNKGTAICKTFFDNNTEHYFSKFHFDSCTFYSKSKIDHKITSNILL